MCVCVCTYICVATEWFKCHCSFVFCKYQALCYFVRVLLGPTSPAGRQMKKTFSIIKNTDMIKRSGLFLFFVFKLGLKVNFCFLLFLQVLQQLCQRAEDISNSEYTLCCSPQSVSPGICLHFFSTVIFYGTPEQTCRLLHFSAP